MEATQVTVVLTLVVVSLSLALKLFRLLHKTKILSKCLGRETQSRSSAVEGALRTMELMVQTMKELHEHIRDLPLAEIDPEIALAWDRLSSPSEQDVQA